jgi:hypothetical protein
MTLENPQKRIEADGSERSKALLEILAREWGQPSDVLGRLRAWDPDGVSESDAEARRNER